MLSRVLCMAVKNSLLPLMLADACASGDNSDIDQVEVLRAARPCIHRKVAVDSSGECSEPGIWLSGRAIRHLPVMCRVCGRICDGQTCGTRSYHSGSEKCHIQRVPCTWIAGNHMISLNDEKLTVHAMSKNQL